MADELRALNLKPACIVITHSDPDHVGSANELKALTGAKICAPSAERGYLEGTERIVPLFRRAVGWIMLSRQAPPDIDRWLEPGDAVADLQVLATPGHTPGHIALVSGRTLFAGDAIDTATERVRERPGILTADRVAARRSIESLAALDLDACYCGHGPVVHHVSRRLAELSATWRSPATAPSR